MTIDQSGLQGHVQISNTGVPPGATKPRLRSRDSSESLQKTPGRRPMSGSYSSHDFSGGMTPVSRRDSKSRYKDTEHLFSWLKAPTRAFTFKTLRHYALC